MQNIDTKRELRAVMRARRRDLSDDERAEASASLHSHLLTLIGLSRPHRVAAYIPNDGEIDPMSALDQLVERGVEGYLPVIFGTRRPRLRFARYHPKEPLTFGKFGIPIPFHDKRELKNPVDIDWLLMPLVAFDASGSRIGMGGGFYDATLAVSQARRAWRRPKLIGIAHEFQRVERLEVDSWDIPLDGILTDRGFRSISCAANSPSRGR